MLTRTEEFEEVLKEKAKEEELASGTSFAPSIMQRPSLPTANHLCGQALQGMYNDFIRDWQEARNQHDTNSAASAIRALAPLLEDFVEQQANFLHPDRRWMRLNDLRDEFKGFAQAMGEFTDDGFWNHGSSLLADIQNLARAFQHAY